MNLVRAIVLAIVLSITSYVFIVGSVPSQAFRQVNPLNINQAMGPVAPSVTGNTSSPYSTIPLNAVVGAPISGPIVYLGVKVTNRP